MKNPIKWGGGRGGMREYSPNNICVMTNIMKEKYIIIEMFNFPGIIIKKIEKIPNLTIQHSQNYFIFRERPFHFMFLLNFLRQILLKILIDYILNLYTNVLLWNKDWWFNINIFWLETFKYYVSMCSCFVLLPPFILQVKWSVP